jgi:hypothetical protein
MKGWKHVDGQGCTVFCRSCETELPGGPWPTANEAFEQMKEHGWAKGPDICGQCGDSFGRAEAAGLVSFRKDAWENVEEIAPGVWVEKTAPAAAGRRRRKIRRLL